MNEASNPTSENVVEMLPALRAFARTFYRNQNDADDLVQDTLVRALNSYNTFTPGTQLKSWLFTIMRNAFYTQIRKSSREPVPDQRP
jgi:RNA polymerase sigma factor (sigma-70 family)